MQKKPGLLPPRLAPTLPSLCSCFILSRSCNLQESPGYRRYRCFASILVSTLTKLTGAPVKGDSLCHRLDSTGPKLDNLVSQCPNRTETKSMYLVFCRVHISHILPNGLMFSWYRNLVTKLSKRLQWNAANAQLETGDCSSWLQSPCETTLMRRPNIANSTL